MSDIRVNHPISHVKLLQGDVSEAWRENGSDYATVAMRFSLVDAIVEEVNGRRVSGDRTRPTEATELWTFRREDRGPAGRWQLSAIQQAALVRDEPRVPPSVGGGAEQYSLPRPFLAADLRLRASQPNAGDNPSAEKANNGGCGPQPS